MRVGVLGGGMQGCCTALVLAERGVDVVLLDRNQSLLSRAAVANEGKIHLGYLYAGDPSLATARIMMQGALSFAPFLHRYLGVATEKLRLSAPAQYAVHRSSQHGADAVETYLTRVHQLITSAAGGRERAYFGRDLSRPPRRWANRECRTLINPESVVAVFETQETSIDPDEVATSLRAAVTGHPRIETRLGHLVLRAERDDGVLRVVSQDGSGPVTDRFDHIVNALWDGRMAFDRTLGLGPNRPWLHRLKYGITFTAPDGVDQLSSVTVVSGPFGEVVSYPNRNLYLTWYPECVRGMSTEVAPPDWPTYPAEPMRSQIVRSSLAALANVLPWLDPLTRMERLDATVRGGVVVAWGSTDIDNPTSELHRRFEIGVTSEGCYHSIDPGKLTMAPYFAEQCAERIVARC